MVATSSSSWDHNKVLVAGWFHVGVNAPPRGGLAVFPVLTAVLALLLLVVAPWFGVRVQVLGVERGQLVSAGLLVGVVKHGAGNIHNIQYICL